MQMDWLRLIKAFGVAALCIFFTDWYFFGRPSLHGPYQRFPGVWRKYADKSDEIRSIVYGTAFAFAVSAIFLIVCGWLNIHSITDAVLLGAAFWLAGPCALLLSYKLVMNLDRTIILNHGLGWLARFMASAVAYGLLARG